MIKRHRFHRFLASVPSVPERMGSNGTLGGLFIGPETDTDAPCSLGTDVSAPEKTDAQQKRMEFADEPFPRQRRLKPPVVPQWVERLKAIKANERRLEN